MPTTGVLLLLTLTAVGGLLSLWITHRRSHGSGHGVVVRKGSTQAPGGGGTDEEEEAARAGKAAGGGPPPLPSHKRREIHKDRRRKESVRFLAVKRPVYDNIEMYGPDGVTLLCTVGQKKADWYTGRKLAVWRPTSTSKVDDSSRDDDGDKEPRPRAIQLLFEPANSRQAAVSVLYNTSPKRNICVVCGSPAGLMRHYVVPYAYRRRFPPRYKSHMAHDVVLLCLDCHVCADRAGRELRDDVYDRTLRADPRSGVAVLPDRRLRQVRSSAQALLRHADKLPPDRRKQYERVVTEHLLREEPSPLSSTPPPPSGLNPSATRHDNASRDDDVGNTDDGSVHDDRSSSDDVKDALGDIPVSTLERLSRMDTDFPNPLYVPLADLVVATLRTEEDIVSFVRDWRGLFVETLAPRFLPKGWSVDSPVRNDGNESSSSDNDDDHSDGGDYDDDEHDIDDDEVHGAGRDGPRPPGAETDADEDEDDDVDSSGCCDMNLNSSHSTLASDDGIERDSIGVGVTDNPGTTVHCAELEGDIQQFWRMVTDSKTTEGGPTFFEEIVAFCETERNRNRRHRREGETPSAALAAAEATELRQRFTGHVVALATWDRKAQESWRGLSADDQDEFLSRLFLPGRLGGLL